MVEIDPFLEDIQPWGTHRRLLYKALEATSGPVLELGMGNQSTPFLHRYCSEKRRFLSSVEHNKTWFDQFREFASSDHYLTIVDSYDHPLLEKAINQVPLWSVVLVDHGDYGPQRIVEIKRLLKKTEIFVVHDTEPESELHYFYSTVWPLFKFRVDDASEIPHATAVSNTIDIGELFLTKN